LKILFLTNGFPPHRWAGTETYTAGIAKELKGRGCRIQVLCVGGWRNGKDYFNGYDDDLYHDISVRRLNLNWKKSPEPFRYLYDNPVVAEYLSSYLQQVEPDLVHVTSCETLSASPLQVVKAAGLPLVLSLTDFWFLCPRINLLRGNGENCDGQTTPWECLRCQLRGTKAYRWSRRMMPASEVRRFLTAISRFPLLTRQRGLRGMAGDMAQRKSFLRQALRWADCRITASRFVHDIFVENGITAPIRVQPYGHDLSWLEGYAGKTSSHSIRIGFIGQISHSKGVHLLLKAASALQNTCGDKFSLLIYGNMSAAPGYASRLRELKADIKDIRFCGTYAHQDSAGVFAGIDVLVVPSLWYDFPLIIHEAFATKTPVIATNLAGMAEAVIHDINGLLFERGNVGDLAAQIKRVLEEPGLLERLREGIPPVKRIAEEVDELERIYLELTISN
jgi:glycosyltransferase involved in cell wall biosynthesis